MKFLASVFLALAISSVGRAQDFQQGPYGQQPYGQQSFGQAAYPGGGLMPSTPCDRGGGCAKPTVCCRRWWDPYAYTRSYWDPCSCSWIICWYGAWKMDCHRPCNSYGGGGYGENNGYQQAGYGGGPF